MSKEITSKTKRLANILSLLEKGPVKVYELADRFGVSVRTVQRDMGLLALAKVPVHSPKQSVYEFVQGFSLATLHLSCEQAALLAVSADIAKQIGGNFEGAREQIARRFTLSQEPILQESTNTELVRPSLPNPLESAKATPIQADPLATPASASSEPVGADETQTQSVLTDKNDL